MLAYGYALRLLTRRKDNKHDSHFLQQIAQRVVCFRIQQETIHPFVLDEATHKHADSIHVNELQIHRAHR